MIRNEKKKKKLGSELESAVFSSNYAGSTSGKEMNRLNASLRSGQLSKAEDADRNTFFLDL